MTLTPVVLGILAVLLAGPALALMGRWPGLRRTPVAAMLLWQSVAMAAVLSAVGAGLSLATHHGWREEGTLQQYAVAAIALSVTGLVVGRLLLSGHRVGTNLRALRRRHRGQLDLLSRSERGARVVEHDVPVAYCLPGMTGSRVVVSAGALERLEDDEVDAVLAHEWAHLKARHDLVLEGFSVLHQAFPRWVSSRAALAEVQLLAEVLADRAASRIAGSLPLARALVTLAEGRAPRAALGAAGPALAERVRLLGQEPHPAQSVVVVLLALGVLALPTAFVVLPWLASLA